MPAPVPLTPPTVLVTEHLAEPALAWLNRHAHVVRAQPGSPEFEDCASRVEGLVVRTYTRVDEDLLALLPALKVVGRGGVGLDNVCLKACRARGVPVVYTPDSNTQAVLEYVLCLLCDALRPRLFLDRPVPRQEWDAIREEVCGLWQMNERSLGILGLGRIGSRLAQVAQAIGFTVRYCDIREIPERERHGAECVDMPTLFAESDVISVHVDGRPGNRHLVGPNVVQMMRPDVLFLNTSRGFVVDHEALASFMRANPAAMAMLDVHDPEPIADANPLLGLPNAHLAPHLASRTTTALENMSWVVRDVIAVLAGREPRWPAWPA